MIRNVENEHPPVYLSQNPDSGAPPISSPEHQVALQQYLLQAAEALGIPLEHLTERQPVINALLDYFSTGTLPELTDEQRQQIPKFVRPRLLAVDDRLLAVQTVMRRNHPIAPAIEEAFVTFLALDTEQDVPPWKEITDDSQVDSHESVAYPFTSALPLQRNLIEFADIVRSPGSSPQQTP